MPDRRTELVNALNSAIVEAKAHELPATAELYGVVRDQTEASPLTESNIAALVRIATAMDSRTAALAAWKQRMTWGGIIAGLLIGAATVWEVIAPYLHLKP